MALVRVAAAVASLLATTCYGKEFSASVSEIDVIPLMPYEPYTLPRMRWTDLNRALGSEASDKMLKSKEVDTLLGKIGVLKEDKAAFDKLSPMEVQSLYGDSEFEKEKDVLVALELYGEGDVASGIEILEQVQSHIERTRGKSHPLYANGLADLGLGHMLQRDFTKAHELLIAAMTLDEANQDKFGVYNLAASINLMVTSALRSGGGQFEPLSAAYETAFNALHKIEHPARYEIVVNMASMYRTHWRPLRAIQMFKIAKQLDAPPRYSGDVAHGLGLSYLMMGEAKQAKDLFQSAIESYETHGKDSTRSFVDATFQLATAEIMLGQYGRALRHLQTLRKSPHVDANPLAQALVMTTLGQCLVEMGYVEQSIAMLAAALARLESAEPVAPANDLSPYLPFIHIKLLHWTATAHEKQDANATATAAHHTIAYERSAYVLGENHRVTQLHQAKVVR